MPLNIRSMDHWDYYIHDNYVYNCNKTMKDGTKYLVCKYKQRKRCNATCILKGEVFRPGKPHSVHDKESLETWEAEIAFRRSLYLAVVSTRQPLKDLYESLIILHPEIENDITFTRIKRTMSRWREKAALPAPSTYAEVDGLLHTNEWEFLRSYSVGPHDPRMFEVFALSDEVMVIYDANFMRNFKIDKLYITTTTKIIPEINTSKYLTIVLGQMKKYVFPLIWTLSKNYSSTTVKNVVQKIKDLLTDCNVTYDTIYYDAFYDLMKSVNEIFPEIPQKKYSFDSYCKILRAVARDKGVDEHDPVINNILRKLMTLALLPEENICNAFAAILGTIHQNMPNRLDSFITYSKENWIMNMATDGIDLFDDVHTIHDVSNIHLRMLQNKLNEPNPSFWKFLEFIGTHLSKMVKDCQKIFDEPDGRLIINFSPQINASINKNGTSVTSEMKKLGKLFIEDKISYMEFVERGLVVLQEFYDDMFFDNYIMPEELAVFCSDLVPFLLLDTSLLPQRMNNPEADDGENNDPENKKKRSNFLLNQMEKIINELGQSDISPEVINGNQKYSAKCRKCTIRLVTTINLPCKHAELCHICNLRRKDYACSICKEFVTRMERVFLPADAEGEGYNLNCEICFMKPVNIMWTTCNHGLSCRRCAVEVVTRKTNTLTTKTELKCPHCNQNAEGFIEFELGFLQP